MGLIQTTILRGLHGLLILMGMFCGCCGASAECVVNSTIPAIGKPFTWDIESGVPVFDGQAIHLSGYAAVNGTHGQITSQNPLGGTNNEWLKNFHMGLTLNSVNSRVLLHTHWVDEDDRVTYDIRVESGNSWKGAHEYPILYLIKWEKSSARTADMPIPEFTDSYISSVMILDKWEPGYQLFFATLQESEYRRISGEDVSGGSLLAGSGGPGVLTVLTPKLFNSTNAYTYAINGASDQHTIATLAELAGFTVSPTVSEWQVNDFRIENISGDNTVEYITLYDRPIDAENTGGCPGVIATEPRGKCTATEQDNPGVPPSAFYWPGTPILHGSAPVAVNVVLPDLDGDPCCGDGAGGVVMMPRLKCSGDPPVEQFVLTWYVTVGGFACDIAPNGRWAFDLVVQFATTDFIDEDVFPTQLINAAIAYGTATFRPDQLGTINYFSGFMRNDDVPTSRAHTFQNHLLPDDVIYPFSEPEIAAVNLWVAIDHSRWIYPEHIAWAGYQCVFPGAFGTVVYAGTSFSIGGET